MAGLDDAQVVGGVDDVVELSEFRVRLYGPGAPNGEIDFTEISPLGQFEIPRIMRDYGAEPRKIKRLSSKINYEPVKCVTYLPTSDNRLRKLINQSRPRRGTPGTPLYDMVVNFLDRDGNDLFGIKMVDGIIYQHAGFSLNAASQDQPAKIEFMFDFFDWDYTDL